MTFQSNLPTPAKSRQSESFKNGKLYHFESKRILVVRPWPEMRAWYKTATKPWQPTRKVDFIMDEMFLKVMLCVKKMRAFLSAHSHRKIMPVFAELANTENRRPTIRSSEHMTIFTHTLSQRSQIPKQASARQWLLFPFQASARLARLRTFRLLIETESGMLIFLEFKHRKLTKDSIREVISILVDDDERLAPSSSAINLLREMGLQPVLLDEPIVIESFCTPDIIGEVVLDDFLMHVQRGEQLVAGHRTNFQRCLEDELRGRMNQFVSNLNRSVVQTILDIKVSYKPTTHNYLTGKSKGDSLIRTQAARVFPVFVPALATGGLREINEAIEAQMPLVDAVSSALNVSRSVVRAICSVDLETAGVAWANQPRTLIRLLATLPADFRPKEAEAWSAFNSVIQTISQLSGMPPLCSRNRLWLHACAARKFKVENLGAELEKSARDIDEFISALVSVLNFELRWDHLHCSGCSVNAVEEFIASQNDILKFAKIASRYEAAFIKESTDFANAEEKALLSGARWKSLLETPFVTTFRSIHHLVTAEELVVEGTEMQHCCAGYVGYCLSGQCAIFSVRDRDGQRCSTMEVEIVPDSKGGIRANFVQHKGKKNVEPSRECKMATLSLLRHLNEDKKTLTAFVEWRKNVASIGKDARALHVLMRPITAAVRKVLPKAWPLERLIALAQEYAQKEQP